MSMFPHPLKAFLKRRADEHAGGGGGEGAGAGQEMQGAPVFVHLDPVFGKPLERLRIDAVFLRVDAALESVERLARDGGHGGLYDHLAVIHDLIDKMHGAACNLYAPCLRVRRAGEAGEGGQQGGMDVDHAMRERIQETRRQHTHVPGKGYGIRPRFQGGVRHRAIIGFAARPQLVIHHRADDPGGLGALNNLYAGPVADHKADVGVQRAAPDGVRMIKGYE